MTKRIGLMIAVLTTLVAGGFLLRSQQKSDPMQEMRAQMQRLEARVQELERRQPLPTLQAKYRARWAQDTQKFSREQMAEIETLYQNIQKKWSTSEAIESGKALIDRFPSADRSGCATLYLGQMTRGKEREQYLKKAITKYFDSMYGDGVQVGAFARFLLATDLLAIGRKEEAQELFRAIRTQYPDAVDHSGAPLVSQIPEE